MVLGYPLALWIVSLKAKWRPLAIAAVLTPLLVNVVVRSLGMELLLAPDGLINDLLGLLRLPKAQHLLYNYGAVGVGLVQAFLPFMVLALYDVLQSASPRVLEAAESLGASRPVRFFSVELPLSLPGLRAGVTFVFLMASTTYVSARMLGGKIAWTTGMVVWQEVLENLDAQFASALAMIMTVMGVAATLVIALGGAQADAVACRPGRPRRRLAAPGRRRHRCGDPAVLQGARRRIPRPAAPAAGPGVRPELQRRAPGDHGRVQGLHPALVPPTILPGPLSRQLLGIAEAGRSQPAWSRCCWRRRRPSAWGASGSSPSRWWPASG